MFWFLLACRVEVGAPQTAPIVAGSAPAGEVWIYTSMYPSVIAELEPALRAAYPDIEPKFFQAGSEKVAQRVQAEWDAGSSPACLLLTSDPFWYVELAESGRLQPHLPPNALHVANYDRDGLWIASRYGLMVLAANTNNVPEPPKRIADLADPRFRGRVTMADPLASGTAFTALAFFDAPFIEGLKANAMVASGGNSAVLARLETGEQDVGLVLLENLIVAKRKGSPVAAFFPEDGAILVPGPIAMTAGCPNPAAAAVVYDFLLSKPGQEAIVRGDMYAALPEVAPPEGAPPLESVVIRPWTAGFAETVVADKLALKGRWQTP